MPRISLILDTENLPTDPDARADAVDALLATFATLAVDEVLVAWADGVVPPGVGPVVTRTRAPVTFVAAPADYYAAKNAAAAVATGDVLVFTDADCRPDAGWLDALLAPLSDLAVVGVVGQTRYARSPGSRAEDAVDFVTLPALAHRGDVHTLFANNFAFRRAAFPGFEPTPPGAHRGPCQLLAMRLRAEGRRLAFAPDARVTHRRPRSVRLWVARRLLRGQDLRHLSGAIFGRVGLPFLRGRLGGLTLLALRLPLAVVRDPLQAPGALLHTAVDAVGVVLTHLPGGARDEATWSAS